LVTSQITCEYQTKDSQLAKVKNLASSFKFFEAIFVPREDNARTDLLAKLASTKKPGNNRMVIQEIINTPSTEAMGVNMISDDEQGWMTPIVRYLTGSFQPKNDEEEATVRKKRQSSPR
jgi:hydroxymethylglutaryl-CoA reductase